MRPPKTALAALAACSLMGCSLLVHFDPDGQPCDPTGRCLDGYVCRDGRCRAGDEGDAGASCGTCPAGQTCSEGTCVGCLANEANCADGHDDDCDGLSDCADPDCLGQACDDGDRCTSAESCQPGGTCGEGTALDCSDPPPTCTETTGSCDPLTGGCVYSPLFALTACDDGDGCTTADRCDGAGACVAGVAVTCATPPGDCYLPLGVCSPDAGACVYQPKPQGTACDDRNPCTTGERCDGAGLCSGGTGLSCTTPPSKCFAAQGTCNQNTQTCVYTPLASGTACSDGNACTSGDTCNGTGVCVGGPSCTTTNACKTGSCVAGACVFSNKANGTSCGTAASKRCCTGTCVDISNNAANCGGCGNACGGGYPCESVSVTSACAPSPANTTGRCRCIGSGNCPHNQVCTTNQTYTLRCAPTAAANCGTGQIFHDLPTCPNYCSY